MYKVRPTLRGLSDEQITLMHKSVLTILGKAGIRVDVFHRGGAPAFSLDSEASGKTVYGIGSPILYFQEPLTDNVFSEFMRFD
jgi:hypothetical protein